MSRGGEQACVICGAPLDDPPSPSLLSDAGVWATTKLCDDGGEICRQCRENRALLALMYVVDR